MDRTGIGGHARPTVSYFTPVLHTSATGAKTPTASAPMATTIRPRSAAALATVASALHHQASHPQSSLRAESAAAHLHTQMQMAARTGAAAATAAAYGHRMATASPSHAAAASPAGYQAGASTAATPATAVAAAGLSHPNESLIRQIEDQWAEYMRAVASEQAKGSSTGGGVGASGSVSSLSVLLGRLQSNSLLNFFEFQSSRSILTVYGPSFDCLYWNPPLPSPTGVGYIAGSIYRDKQDYLHTLGSLTSLSFKCVDFQLVALQLPLVRARCPKLKHLQLCANNIHALYQLDDLALFAPTAPLAPLPSNPLLASFSPASSVTPLETMTLQQNAIAESPLYRRYLVSVLTMNLLQRKDGPATTGGGGVLFTSLRSANSNAAPRASISTTGVPMVTTLDGRPVTEDEMASAWQTFNVWHREKYALNPPPLAPPSAAPVAAASRWLEQLCDLSVHHHGGPAALGTAANALYMPTTGTATAASSASSIYPSALPLPLRPVGAPATARRGAKKLVEELISRAIGEAAHQRAFEAAWTTVVLDGERGAVAKAVLGVKATLAQDATAALHADSRGDYPPTSGAASAVGPTAMGPSSSASALHRDKTRMMKLFNTSAPAGGGTATGTLPRKKRG